MKHRIPQAMATRGMVSGCPIGLVSNGLITQRPALRVAAIGRRHNTVTPTTPIYVATVEHALSAKPSTYAAGDYIESFDIHE